MQEEKEKREIPTLQIIPIFAPAVELHGSRERSGFAVRRKRNSAGSNPACSKRRKRSTRKS